MNLNVPTLQTPKGGTNNASRGVTSLGVSSGTGSATGNPRNKTALKPGRSLMDWIRLGTSGKDMTGTGGKKIEVTLEELAKHNTQDDAWIAIRGNVFNITPYMEFHPGGIEELMKGAGIDGTQLFDDVHKWVNYQSMLGKCHVGKLAISSPSGSLNRAPLKKANSLSVPNGGRSINMPPPPVPRPFSGKSNSQPRFEWFQTDSTVAIVIYTKRKDIRNEDIIIDLQGPTLLIKVIVGEYIYHLHKELECSVATTIEVKAIKSTGKVEVSLQKISPAKKWEKLGNSLEQNEKYVKHKDTDTEYHECIVSNICRVTHDTNLYKIMLPEGYKMSIPIGCHVYVKGNVNDMDIVRAYTVVSPSLFLDSQDRDMDSGRAFFLMVKIYDDGALTGSLFKSVGEGDLVTVSQMYEGDFQLSSLDNCTHLILYAAGTGFTPMVRLMLYALECEQNTQSKVNLVFFNKSNNDILCYDALESLASKHENFSVTYILSQPHAEWTGETGRVRKELMESSLPSVESGSILLCACGPTAFTQEVIRLAHEEFNYTNTMTHAFIG